MTDTAAKKPATSPPPSSKWSPPPASAGDFYKCAWVHDGSDLVLDSGGKKLAGATVYDIPWSRAALVLACAEPNSGSAGNFVKSGPADYLALNAKFRRADVVRLDWPDMSAPEGIGIEFWRSLWEMLPSGLTVAACQGSHGRSGTLMAALLLASGAFSEAVEAIVHVRAMHCDQAIEASSQIRYLKRLAEEAADHKYERIELGVPQFDDLDGEDLKLLAAGHTISKFDGAKSTAGSTLGGMYKDYWEG